jgi:hypothetical protein
LRLVQDALKKTLTRKRGVALLAGAVARHEHPTLQRELPA